MLVINTATFEYLSQARSWILYLHMSESFFFVGGLKLVVDLRDANIGGIVYHHLRLYFDEEILYCMLKTPYLL